MSDKLRIRTRWADLLTLQWPRYVIGGSIVHRAPSDLIRNGASRDAFATLQRGGPQRRRLLWMMFVLLAVFCPYMTAYFLAAFSGPVLDAYGAIDTLPWWASQPIAMIGSGVILAVGITTALMLLEPIVMWGMRPHFRRAVKRVGAWWCLRCNYDLRGHSVTDRCPECGEERIATRMATT